MGYDPVLQIPPNIYYRAIPLHIGLDPHIYVPAMTVRMHEIVFHHHLEKGACPDHRDGFVQFVRMVDVKGDWQAL